MIPLHVSIIFKSLFPCAQFLLPCKAYTNLLQMLPPQALLAAILFFQFFRSGVSTTTLLAPSLATSAASLQTNSSMTPSNSSDITATPSATHNSLETSVAKSEVASTTVGNGGQVASNVSPTKSGAPSVNQTASVSVAYSKSICTARINTPGRGRC